MKLVPVNTLISLAMRRRMASIETLYNQAADLQEIWLKKLLQSGSQTVYGKQFGFNEIRDSETFRQQVPLQDYEGLKPYIEQTRAGTQNILWPTHIKWFAKSSGTTGGRSKFLPVSFEAIESCHFKGGKDLLAIYCALFPETTLFSGFSLRLGGSTSINSANHESYYGDLSALMIENLPFWVEIRSTPNQRVALMEEWESKIAAISKQAVRQNVTSLFGVPSWMLVLCKHILELTGKSHMHEVWPNMELYAHGGVSFAPYRKQFEALFPGNNMTFLETYNASEGFFAIQDNPKRDDLLLLIDHGIYYEFLPFQGNNPSDVVPIPLVAVQIGVNYAMVITTNSGLWRYKIGDTVKFTHRDPYRIQITGRTKHFINAFGEELIIENAEKAIQKASQALGISVIEYSAAPVYMEQKAGAHEWIFEFDKPLANLEQFGKLLDEALKAVNTDYEAKRHKNMALRPPILHLARQSLFHDWLKKHNKLGGQHKIPRLMNDRTLMDELLKMNQS
jgi:hypothetical protein